MSLTKKTSIVAILAALLLCCSLFMAGCSSSSSDTKASGNQAKENTTEQTEFNKARANLDEKMKASDVKGNSSDTYGLILSSLGNEFWQTEKDGAMDAAKEFGVTLDVQATDKDTDYTGQLDIMQTMVSKKYKALAVSPLSENNLVNGIADANKAGVKVILNGTLQNEDAMKAANASVDGTMQMDFMKQGTMAGEFAAKKCNNKGNAAIIAGTEGATNSDGRRDGAKNAMEKAGMKVVAVQQCDFDQQKAYDATKSIMQANPDIVAITCGNDDMAMGVIKALDELGKKDNVVVVGNDFTSEAKESIKAGKLDATVAMSPYLGGRACTIAMIRASQGENVGTVTDYIPMNLVSADNVADMEDWK